MTNYHQILTQLSFNFDLIATDVALPTVTMLAVTKDALTIEKSLTEAPISTLGAITVSASIIQFSKFRPATTQNNNAQLYENIFESIKHIG